MFKSSRTPRNEDFARLLVIDDNLISRKKLKLATEQLGHLVETASDGASGLEAIAAGGYDAVLLDIVMPGLDGFDVLRALNDDGTINNIPVIVVSALDDDPESVVRAIRLGAVDFLPKEFDPVILNARLQASLSRKRFIDREREYFGRIEQLTQAAEIVETGRVSPQTLKLDDLAEYDDPIGRLAAVFRGMASEIHARERKLLHTIHTLRGILLLAAFGLVWGLDPALSRLSSTIGSNPIGLAVWVNAVAAVGCLGIAAYRGKLQWLKRDEISFFVVWAILAGIFQRLTLFTLATHVEATMLSLVITVEGFMVFAGAAVMGMEKASARRLLGLSIGLIGIVAVLLMRVDATDATANWWLLAALAMPLLFAIETIFLAGKRPEHIDIFAAIGFLFSFSLVFLIPLGIYMGDLMPVPTELDLQTTVIILLGFVAAGTNLLYFYIVATTGPIFASQAGYVSTLSGILWGIMLLGEDMPLIAWLAFILVIIGMYLVETKPSAEEIVVKRSFSKKSVEE